MFSQRATSLMLSLLTLALVNCQPYRKFPPLSNLARERSVSTEPTQSSCGVPTRSTFCRSSTASDSVTSCIPDYCDPACPLRYEAPVYSDLLKAGNYDACVTKDTINTGTKQTSYSAFFLDNAKCYLVPSEGLEIGPLGQVTLGFWMRQSPGNVGTIVDKQDDGGSGTVLNFRVSANIISLQYLTELGLQSTEFKENYIPPSKWTHVAIQIYDRFINLYIDGTEVGSSPVVAGLLAGRIIDRTGTSRVGQSVNGTAQYVGRIQDLRAYSDTLSNREIDEMMTGVLPYLHTQSACRCPASHPRVKPQRSRYCVKNGMGDTTVDQVLRLGPYAHPLEFINDGDTNSIWISTQTSQVFISVDLGDTFQVFYVVVQFYSPLPKTVRIQRQSSAAAVWQDWQYYAADCQSYFGLENNGALATPSSVNCLQLSLGRTNEIPYSRGNVTFSILSQAPIARPGHNDFYNTPDLYSFVKARSVRVSFKDHYYATNPKHQYFGVYEFLVTGRCDCSGHAEQCDTSKRPYVCRCDSESRTQGAQCSSCLPLFNAKPFRVGDQVNPYNCRECNCYLHADSCAYNATLDPFPAEHNRGGGGQCVNCRHNTQGIHCDKCTDLYYRDLNVGLSSPNVCLPCGCDVLGTVAGRAQCDQSGGQCPCKANVEGRRCDRCKAGTYHLLAANPIGCSACLCDLTGVKGGNINCDGSGACSCKKRVRGDKCGQCDYGFYNLTSSNVEGCLPCDCDHKGSSSRFCNPETGECQCKTNVHGPRCDECVDSFWNLSSNCLPCSAHCNQLGTESGSLCDKTSGQCVCKANVQGHACDKCRPLYYSFGSSTALGCTSCGCHVPGTVDGSATCGQSDGKCVCKNNVKGRTCNECKVNTYGLTATNSLGCKPCDCDRTGTLHGDTTPVDQLTCSQNNGTCTCLSNRVGRRCDSCEATFYISTKPGGGCLSCGCHSKGSLSLTCHMNSGQCSCKSGSAGVMGQKCGTCQPKFYNFDGTLGRCSPCDCSAAGSVNGTCDSTTGQCDCKQFVEGRKCDVCIAGAGNLNADNPYGCSKVPSQQPPPTHVPISPTALTLSWAPPDLPNGNILTYILYRDGRQLDELTPFSRSYNDTGLVPYMTYKYKVRSYNEFGYAESPEVTFRTPAGAPSSGAIVLTVTNVLSYSATFSWNAVSNATGVIEKYILTYITDREPQTTVVLFQGLALSTSSQKLSPYTNYTFTASACTSGGCLDSAAVWVLTPQAPPAGQQDPVVTALSSNSLLVEWNPPSQPNGVIIFYELWMKGVTKADGSVHPPLARIFHPSGQYNARPDRLRENALPPPATNFTVTGLRPFTEYEFQVLSQNDVAKTASGWVTARTLEAAPASMPAPTVTAISSSSLLVQWAEPSSGQVNGEIKVYRLLQIFDTDLVVKPFDPPTFARELYSNDTVRKYTVTGLLPYSTSRFVVQVCNSVGCVDSIVVSATTLPAVPSVPHNPAVRSLNSSTLMISWEEPKQLNGPAPTYTVLQSEAAFSAPSPRVMKGTRFPGGGYYHFPANTIAQGVVFTGVEMWFKTRRPNGLLLFSASARGQEEFLAIQLRDGLPWFLFDPQGCVTTVGINAVVAKDTSYADDAWHQLVVRRTGATGSLTIDGNVTGTGRGDCATGTIIGKNTGVYIGGLPRDFVLSTAELKTKIVRQGFQGCIKDVKTLQLQTPGELWDDLYWYRALAHRDSYPGWYGCPVDLEQPSTHFLGQGWLEINTSPLLQNAQTIQIELRLRTEYTDGLLFFVYGGRNVYLYAMISKRSLMFVSRQEGDQFVVTWNSEQMSLCDGQWKTVKFLQTENQLTIAVDGVQNSAAIPPTSTPTSMNLTSNIYLGGLPPDSEASRVATQSGVTLAGPFSGCMKQLTVNSRSLDLWQSMESFSVVNFDGCPALQQSYEGCQSPVHRALLSSNTSDDHRDIGGLRGFTDYLFQVRANNSAGYSETGWIVGTTKESTPTGVQVPHYAKATSGYSIDVRWTQPTGNTGFISRYTLWAHNLQREGEKVPQSFYEPSELRGELTGTTPYTNYSVHLEACTAEGCARSAGGISVQTLQERPEDVRVPYVVSNGPSHIIIGWAPPLHPNGPITGYHLYHNDELKYSGGLTTFNSTGLQVYTSYVFKLAACTVIGCTNSTATFLSTAETAPEFVRSPILTVYGTRRIDVKWSAPDRVNGVIERYLLYMSVSALHLPGDLVYNSSDIGFLTYRNESLRAGTTYYVTLEACTGGGCTRSEAASAATVESSPDMVQDPVIVALSPYALQVTWSPPRLPNGIVTEYRLAHNSVPRVYESPDVLVYNATGLLPYSQHTFQLTVCTAKGCTLSNEVTGRTMEAAPQGTVHLQVEPVSDPRQITAKWTRLQTPNGAVTYTLYFHGLFYVDPVAGDYTTLRQRRALLSTPSADKWFTVIGLTPYSRYELQVNASSSVGYIISNLASVDLPAGAPDGVRPPTLTPVNSSAINAVWGLPARINGPSPPGVLYQLQFKASGKVEKLFAENQAATSYTKSLLLPYTEYSFRLEAFNEKGSTLSAWASAVTKQSAPSSIDPPITTTFTSRTVELSWSGPGQTNGIITAYRIYQNGSLDMSVPANTTTTVLGDLLPFTSYVFGVEACTVAGCVRSANGLPVLTAQDAPEGLAPPTAVSMTSTSVTLSWELPATPNGILLDYTVERWIDNRTIRTLQRVEASGSRTYVDEGSQLQPYTLYRYRVSARTAGGTALSHWTEIKTRSARPSGFSEPTATVLNSTAVLVSWSRPQSVNGMLERYVVRYDTGKQVLVASDITELVLGGLTAYTRYNITVTACTDGGCTESSVASVLTRGSRPGGVQPPRPIVLSQTYVAIQWRPPESPNGPNVRYTLTRMKVRQPLAASPVGIGLWEEACNNPPLLYCEDRGLSVYTSYIYRLTVHNDYGFMFSDNSSLVVTHGGQPFEPPVLTVTTISHTELKADWTIPDEVILQGSVQSFTLTVSNSTYRYGRDVTRASIDNLTPNTNYTFVLTLYVNGGLSISTQPLIARTADGDINAPQGVNFPLLFVVSDTAIRVAWVEPDRPNGQITSYSLYMDGQRIEAVNTSSSGSYVIQRLKPYTVYKFKLEVCTVYACVDSLVVRGTTAEAQPQGLAFPTLRVLSAVQVQICWAKPEFPNGILLRYSLYRRNVTTCSEEPATESSKKCSYVKCAPLQGLCGTSCYDGVKECCGGVTYTPIQGQECCGTEYVAGRNAADDVCCGGVFHTKQATYECCGNRYVKVLTGEKCCTAAGVVNVGYGNGCCGSTPYSTTGAQICCAGTLHQAHNQQCCGGEVVSSTMTCCGSDTAGMAYEAADDMMCCGTEHVTTLRTACCASSSNTYKAYVYSSSSAMQNSNERCCELKRISKRQSCCNGNGYNPALQVCADVGDGNLSGCGQGTVCSIGSNARCDQCSFNTSLSCNVVSKRVMVEAETLTPPPKERLCKTEPVLIYSGHQLCYKDSPLKPWTSYEYSISVTNKAGTQSTNYQPIRTAQSVPSGLAPPTITVPAGKLHVIRLEWLPPRHPNGEILRYALWRSTDGGPAAMIDGGTKLSYDDGNGIQPFKTYTYTLHACTSVGCTQSEPVDAATKQAPPDRVFPPSARFYNSTAVLLTWSAPLAPNGIIQNYLIYDLSLSIHYTIDGKKTRELLVTGLEPYTAHTYLLSACTEAACTNSTELNVTTLQDIPAGIVDLKSIVLSNTELIVNWFTPSQPNGQVTEYRLSRRPSADGEWQLLYSGLLLSYGDARLTPGHSYQYQLQVTNGAGSVYSAIHSVTLPTSTPRGLTQPTVVQAISPFSIYVNWTEPSNPGGVIDQYQVILNAGQSDVLSTSVAAELKSYTVKGLSPYTRYSVRIGACLQGVVNSCASGPAVFVTTHEAPPLSQPAPILVALAPDVVDVSWTAPKLPNGVIETYTVFRRLVGGPGPAFTVHRGDNKTFSFRNAGPDITPYTQFDYRVTVKNGAGQTASQWSRVRTLEAPPTGQSLPIITVRGAFSIEVSWSLPDKPNGVIVEYVLRYQKATSEPTFSLPVRELRVPGTRRSTTFSGLSPYSTYKVQLVAVNSAGSVSSGWVETKTGESAPAGVRPIQVEPRANGRSILLSWLPPERPNGKITRYILREAGAIFPLYDGLSTEFVYLRLQPFTNYSLRLEACTSAGCSRAPWQTVTTAEIQPENQPSPKFADVSGTSVTIRWAAPLNPYGVITKYEVLRLFMGRRNRRDESPVIVFSTNETHAKEYEYTDRGLLPHSRYQYKVRSSNSRGAADSDWVVVETDQAAPGGVLPPTLRYYGSSFDKVIITWVKPVDSNGLIQSYRLKRNNSKPWSFTTAETKQYIDEKLSPHTVYSYTLTACNSAGCTSSASEIIQTRESSPSLVDSPVVEAHSSTALLVHWLPPAVLNGELLQYRLYLDGERKYSGLNTNTTLTGLSPYTQYRLVLEACTAGGCTSSAAVLGRTRPEVPTGMSRPILSVVSSTTIEVRWTQPSQSNGVVNLYEVRRNGQVVYNASGLTYTDAGLSPNTIYSYIVQASNSIGSVTSAVASIRTYMSSPVGLAPPSLNPLSSTSIRVMWTPPTLSNGVITNYTLFDDFSREVLFSGLQLTATVSGLAYYSMYSIRVKACTKVGCILSSAASVRTLQAPPTGMERPTLTPQATASGAHSAILVVWGAPRKLNGVLTEYRVERRQVLDSSDSVVAYTNALLLYNGTELRVLDNSEALRPYTRYEYRVLVYNGAGSTSSQWARVRTYQGSPRGIIAPFVKAVTSGTITVILSPPIVPNGEIAGYTLLVNGSQSVTSGVGLELTVAGLQPFTTYSIIYRVCTAVACTLSSPTITKTAPDVPSGMTLPIVINITAGSAFIQWKRPTHANGVLTGFKAYQRSGCPKEYQPFYTIPCVPSSPELLKHTASDVMHLSAGDLDPYTSYQWRVEAVNEVGVTQSDAWSVAAITDSAEPVYTADPGLLYEAEGSRVLLDWTKAFTLNSQLLRYELYTRKLSAEGVASAATAERRYSGYETRYTIDRTSSQQDIEVYVSVVTTRGTVRSAMLRIPRDQSVPQTSSEISISTQQPVTAPQSSTNTVTWLVPLIVIAVLLLAIVFFLIVKYCVRGKNEPYEREKIPLPKRQPRQSTLTPISSFHDALNSQTEAADENGLTPQSVATSQSYAASQGYAAPQKYATQPSSQSITSALSSHQTSATPQGISFSKLVPYTSYAGSTAAGEGDQRGAVIWPTEMAALSTHISLPDSPALEHSSPRYAPQDAGPTLKDTNLDDDDDEDVWDSVLQESGMYEDSSEFSASPVAVDFPAQPTTFNDTHL